MEIKDVFLKPIDRHIQGVIKIGQDQDNVLQQELDEYVVTNELQNLFARFFSAYERSLNEPTDEMGVWISGFFGSGKSHFMKIIADVLEDTPVGGKRPVEYFQDKIVDQMTLNQMDRAASEPTDVISFNIDAVSKASAKSKDSAILDVFLQEFNKSQGLSDTAWIADLERQLIADGKYDDFQEYFNAHNTHNLVWNQDGRELYAFNTGAIKEALVASGFMNAADADGFTQQWNTPYPMSIAEFAQLVAKHIESSGRRVVFLVDEVGQFVGDSVSLMLNLQTMVEQLGIAARGKAWVIVTSQQAINEVTKNVNGQDFSKIQGRFKTRINMSSANVDEVIRKRILAKNEPAQRALETEYSGNSASINNSIDFDGEVTRTRYTSEKNFADNYPFVPYQFNLLQDVLTAIRTHGSYGKHLSEGERSMLAIFQKSAKAVMHEQTGMLVPFSLFFDGLDQFLDNTHQIVITRAQENDAINPSHEDNPFAVQVLKTLFMVKYVKNFKATLTNITTLMIDSIDSDRVQLQKNVQNALNILIRQNLVERNLGVYVFLTDAEQDINQEIENQSVSPAEVAGKLGEFVFSGNIIRNKYSYPKLGGRYTFALNAYIDDTPVGKTSNELSLKVITPLQFELADETMQLMYSAGEGAKSVLIVLPSGQADQEYIDNTRRALKIDKFLRSNYSNADAEFQLLSQARSVERTELQAEAKRQVTNALENAKLIVGGQLLESKRDFETRLKDAEQALVDNNYRNLSYITAAKGEKDIMQLLASGDLVETSENELAVNEVANYIQRINQTQAHVTLHTVLDQFKRIPYGYTEEDIEWLLAKLYASSKVKLTYNGVVVSRDKFTDKGITDLLTRKQNLDRVELQLRKVTSERDLRLFRDIARDVFNKTTFSSDNIDQRIVELKAKITTDLHNLQDFAKKNVRFPGQNIISNGINLLQQLIETNDTDTFFSKLRAISDELLDWHDDYEDSGVSDFYMNQSQQEIWKAGLTDLDIYEASKEFIADDKLQNIVAELTKLLRSNKPMGNTPKIGSLDKEFDTRFSEVFDVEEEKQNAEIERIQADGLARFDRAVVSDEYKQHISQSFKNEINEIRNRNAQDIGTLRTKSDRARTVLDRNSQDLQREVQRFADEEYKRTHPTTITVVDPQPTPTPQPTATPKPKTKPVATTKYLNYGELGAEQTWVLKDEQDVDAKLNELRKILIAKLDEKDTAGIELTL
ncbi:BREX system P-loop protein BrxC [Lacticaseibacillus hulanensis]|uniref:BREX system P-loop protein BrxC n=1 Tax=Lacticaseibacillus hulanensis TaxID=2493111 RepID=UPI000FDB8794|nr:BREX system P-loop protein BrxC [Lacticaseibacillus hulanensis]